MAKGRVVFAADRCKGCGLCVEVCPVGIIALDRNSINARGYNPARCTEPERCTGCASCAVMCPDIVIAVFRERPAVTAG